jgi:hypothetical protein
VVEGARLESVYRFIAYLGFESPSLRQEYKKMVALGRPFFLFHGGEKQAACAACGGIRRPRAYSRVPLRIAHLPPRERRRAGRRQRAAQFSARNIAATNIETCHSKAVRLAICTYQPEFVSECRHSSILPWRPGNYLAGMASGWPFSTTYTPTKRSGTAPELRAPCTLPAGITNASPALTRRGGSPSISNSASPSRT